MAKRWLDPVSPPVEVAEELRDFPPLHRQFLFSRGLSTRSSVEEFFNLEVGGDPFALDGLQTGVDRILEAIQLGEEISVYGDYDADGITGTVLLQTLLENCGAQVGHYIPGRFKEGYGLNRTALTQLRQAGTRLVVTVDCGIRASDQIAHANSIGMDVIVTDHHEPGPRLPPAFAIINPKQAEDLYPHKELAGVGLAYKLAQGLSSRLGRPEPTDQLDLVAIGTVADLAPLQGENRTLVKQGLSRLNQTQRTGLKALMKVAGYEAGRLNSTAISFGLAPRLNAAGRLESADLAYQLLRSEVESEAARLADRLNKLNRDRQRKTEQTLDLARQQALRGDTLPDLLFAADAGFSEGIIGLAASRLVEEFYRPAVVACLEETTARASARSIPGFHITKALEHCSSVLLDYGGHSTAAGFTFRREDLNEVVETLSRLAAEALAGTDREPRLSIDAYVSFAELDAPLLSFIERMEPFGQGNPMPVFASRDASILSRRAVGTEGSHLKLTLKHDGIVFDAIAFRQGHLAEELGDQASVAFHFERNEYLGVETLQLNIVDFSL